jgi:hypothetical protein
MVVVVVVVVLILTIVVVIMVLARLIMVVAIMPAAMDFARWLRRRRCWWAVFPLGVILYQVGVRLARRFDG